MVVFKYRLENREGYQQTLIPPGAKFIRVASERGHPRDDDSDVVGVFLWAIVPDDPIPSLDALEPSFSSVVRPRTFSIVMTGENCPWVKPENYIGTYEDGRYVRHIFEVKK